MSSDSKRAWREAELERYAEYKRIRAQARRDRYWDRWEALAAAREPRERLSSDSYCRYEYRRKRVFPGRGTGSRGRPTDSSICKPRCRTRSSSGSPAQMDLRDDSRQIDLPLAHEWRQP